MATEKDTEACRWKVCRLCACKEQDGSLLFAPRGCEQSSDLATIINKYLPLKVKDDGKYPRTICPGCHIQLEATVQFLEIVIAGQAKLREIYESSPTLQNTNTSLLNNNTITLIQENASQYAPDHNVTVQIGDFNKPKKKRGRPKKVVNDTPFASVDLMIPELNIPDETEEDLNGKRKRSAPRRFGEQIQGKELEKIFQVDIDDIDIDIETKRLFAENLKQNEEIGHMEHPNGEVTTVKKYKEKNKGRPYSEPHTCKVCSLKFYSSKLYMAHVALHQAITLEPIENLDLGTHQQISEITDTPILETLSLTDASIDINLDHNIEVYFANGSSMPDISSEIMKSDATKNMDSSNSLLLDHTSSNLFSDSNIHDPVSELITSSIMPIATMPPGEMNKKEEVLPVLQPQIVVIDESKSKTQCPECGKLFNSKQSCNIHMKTLHRGERRFKCEQCGRSFGHSATLNKHALSHFPKTSRGFACDICGKVLRHPSSVLYHKESAHNDGQMFVCKLCGKSFRHRQLLVRHQLVHSEDRPYSCKVCNSSFKTKPNLLKHQKTHTSVKQFECEICNKQFSHKNSLKKHLQLHAGIKPFKCSFCEKSFSQKGNLKEHIRTHTGEKPFVCETCGKSFTVSSQYHTHLQTHQEQNILKCTECGKQFYNKETFKNHSKRHRNDKPFACSCGKSFVDRWTLRKHGRVHTGEKPHTCDICSKSFADSSNLAKHRKIHNIEVPKAMDNTFNTTILLCDNDTEPPVIHMIDESEANGINTCELYETESEILDNPNTISMNDATEVTEVQNVDILDQFIVDEDGNPIRFEGATLVYPQTIMDHTVTTQFI